MTRHRVLAIVKMPEDLFMPNVHKGTCALILEAWRPHRSNDAVFFGFVRDDLSAGYKSKMLSRNRAQDNLERMTADLARFLHDGRARIEPLPQKIRISTINMDMDWDFASEADLESGLPSLGTSQPVEGLFVELARRAARAPRLAAPVPTQTREFEIQELFRVQRGRCPPLKTLAYEEAPVVTSSETSNGVAGYYDVPPEYWLRNCVTVSANGSSGAGKAFWHPYPFAAVPDTLVCEWRDEWLTTPAFCLYVCNAISQNAWRFDYFRKSTAARVLADVRIRLPMKGDLADYAFIEREMNRMPGFAPLLEMLNGPAQEGSPGATRARWPPDCT